MKSMQINIQPFIMMQRIDYLNDNNEVERTDWTSINHMIEKLEKEIDNGYRQIDFFGSHSFAERFRDNLLDMSKYKDSELNIVIH